MSDIVEKIELIFSLTAIIAHQDQMRTGRFNATGMKTALRFKLVVAVTALSTINGAASARLLCAIERNWVPSSRTLSVERERVYHAKDLKFVCISSTGKIPRSPQPRVVEAVFFFSLWKEIASK